MANLKEIRQRISTVDSIKQITSAMKLVSASKLRKAQSTVLKFRPYSTKLYELVNNLATYITSLEDGIYTNTNKSNRLLFVVFGSNRGLCGSFNTNIIKTVISNIDNNIKSNNIKANNVDLICIGKKINDYFVRRKYNVIADYNDFSEQGLIDLSDNLSKQLILDYKTAKYHKIFLVYSNFKTSAGASSVTEQYLPFQVSLKKEISKENDYIFEPGKLDILSSLVPMCLKVNLYNAAVNSASSEHRARMTAMHIATDNATELLKILRLNYNKARQSAITTELLEIVSGAEALKG
ncbi:MAG: ATP synthase F1 subunit gamma [Bacteroidales bacterium]|nr:ATP synthase F1 subunit gamma [Bacteroidales bacterium]